MWYGGVTVVLYGSWWCRVWRWILRLWFYAASCSGEWCGWSWVGTLGCGGHGSIAIEKLGGTDVDGFGPVQVGGIRCVGVW